MDHYQQITSIWPYAEQCKTILTLYTNPDIGIVFIKSFDMLAMAGNNAIMYQVPILANWIKA